MTISLLPDAAGPDLSAATFSTMRVIGATVVTTLSLLGAGVVLGVSYWRPQASSKAHATSARDSIAELKPLG